MAEANEQASEQAEGRGQTISPSRPALRAANKFADSYALALVGRVALAHIIDDETGIKELLGAVLDYRNSIEPLAAAMAECTNDMLAGRHGNTMAVQAFLHRADYARKRVFSLVDAAVAEANQP